MGFDAGRAAVVAGDGVVARYAGMLCVARCTDPDTLRHLLELCSSVAGRDPGRALARRLAVWLTGADAPGERLAFGTVAAAGPRVAVFLSGAVAVVVPDRSVNLSGADSAAWTDRLIDHPDTPLVLTLDGATARPDPAGGLHDLRVGVVPGAGVVLFPAPGGDARPDGDSDADVAPYRSALHGGQDGPEPAAGEGGSGWPWTGPIGWVEPGALFEPGPPAEPWPVAGPAVEGTGAILRTHPGPDAGTDEETGTGGRHAAHAAGGDPHRPDTSDAVRTPASAVPSGGSDGARTADTPQRRAHAVAGDRPPAHAFDADGHAEDGSAGGVRAAAGEFQVRRPPPGNRHAVAGTRETSRPAATDREPPPSESFGPGSSRPGSLPPESLRPESLRPEPYGAGPSDAGLSTAGLSAAGLSTAGLSTAELPTAGRVVSDRSVRTPTAAPAGSGQDGPGDSQRAGTPPGGQPDRAPTNGVERADDPDPPASERTAMPAERRDGAAHELREDHGLCPSGHPIDPRSPECALCEPDEGIGFGPSPRPSSGLLVFDDGAIYTVDAGYLIGRMPGADPRTGSGMLRSIVVQDPSGAVSRVHAEVLVDGAEVVIVDSGSRNGTFVAGPGEPGWTALSPGYAQRLLPGTRVRMGKRTFVFEAAAGVR